MRRRWILHFLKMTRSDVRGNNFQKKAYTRVKTYAEEFFHESMQQTINRYCCIFCSHWYVDYAVYAQQAVGGIDHCAVIASGLHMHQLSIGISIYPTKKTCSMNRFFHTFQFLKSIL